MWIQPPWRNWYVIRVSDGQADQVAGAQRGDEVGRDDAERLEQLRQGFLAAGRLDRQLDRRTSRSR